MAYMRHEQIDLVSLLVRRRLPVSVPRGPVTRDEWEGWRGYDDIRRGGEWKDGGSRAGSTRIGRLTIRRRKAPKGGLETRRVW